MKSFCCFFFNQTQLTATNKNVKPESRHSKLDKFSKMSWFNYNWRKSILNFSNNCYHTIQAVFFLQAEKIPNTHYFSIYYFFPLFLLSIREHCHSTCLQAWIATTREKFLPGLSPNTAVGKTQIEHFILAKSVFFSLFILLDPAAASDTTGHVVQNGQGIWRFSQVLEASTFGVPTSAPPLSLHSTAAPMLICCKFK